MGDECWTGGVAQDNQRVHLGDDGSPAPSGAAPTVDAVRVNIFKNLDADLNVNCIPRTQRSAPPSLGQRVRRSLGNIPFTASGCS
jgi:hypothetical protein